MNKKITIIALAVVMAFVFTSCKKTAETNAGDATKISMLFMEPGDCPFNADWETLKFIEKKQNVKFDMQVVPGRDFMQKRSIVFSSGEIPDIVVNTWPAEMSQFALNGVLLPVSDHLDKLPNLKKIISDWNLADTVKNISEKDGKFYVLPDMRKNLGGNQCFGIRKDIFDKHNIAIPNTYDELLSAMIKLKELYPETLGTGDWLNGSLMMSFMAPSFNTNGGFSLPWGYSYHYDTKEWYYAPTSDEYKQMLTYFHKLYVNGCLDVEGFTQDTNQYNQKMTNSKYFVTPMYGPSDAVRMTNDLRKLGNQNAEMIALMPLAGPTGLRKVKPTSKNQGGSAMPASIAKRPDFDKVMAFCDWLYYSEEGAMLSTLGLEGLTYDKNGSSYTMKPDIKTGNNPEGTIDMKKQYGVGLMGLMTLAPDLVSTEYKKLVKNSAQIDFEQQIIDNNMTVQDDPIIKMTQDNKDRVKLLVTTLNDYTNEMKMKFIYGQESLDNWDKYVQECNEKGVPELMGIIKAAWANQ